MVSLLPPTTRQSTPVKLSVLHTERLEGGLVGGKRGVSKSWREYKKVISEIQCVYM